MRTKLISGGNRKKDETEQRGKVIGSFVKNKAVQKKTQEIIPIKGRANNIS